MKERLINRRQWLAQATGLAMLPMGLMAIKEAHAQQAEEPLTHSMVTALSAAIGSDFAPKLTFDDPEEERRHKLWRHQMSERLKKRIPSPERRIEFLETVRYESVRAGLETELVMGLIHTESAFRQYAISVAGAMGYMQVMPFWTRLIGDGDIEKLFHTQTNLRYGCVILRHYIDLEKGNLFMALGRYNGSRGQSKYPNTVFRLRENWLFDEKTAYLPTVEEGSHHGIDMGDYAPSFSELVKDSVGAFFKD